MKNILSLLALFGMCFSYSAYGGNYTVGSFHQGMIGVGTDRLRSTTTYQQGSNPNGTTNDLSLNLGWFKRFLSMNAPIVSIQSPSGIYTNNTIDLNYTIEGEHIDKCWFSLDGNITQLSNCSNTTLTIPNGIHSLTVYANNTAGNIGYATVSFIVQSVGNLDENGLKKLLNSMSNGVSTIIGSPLLLAIFLGWTAISGFRGDAKMFIAVLIITLIISMLPVWSIFILAILAGLALLVAISKLMGWL